jgi:hypothetical protein
MAARGLEEIAGIDLARPGPWERRDSSLVDGRPLHCVSEICPHPRRFIGGLAGFVQKCNLDAVSSAVSVLVGGGAAFPMRERATFDVFGVNATKFLSEHQTCGCCIANVEQCEPVPRAVVRPGGLAGDVAAVCAPLSAAASYDFSLVRGIVDADLGAQQFDEVMRFTINGSQASAFISHIVNSASAIRRLLAIAQISEAHCFRASFLLSAVLRCESA